LQDELAHDIKLECHILLEWFFAKNVNPLLHLG
jgi:hypothetical protein